MNAEDQSPAVFLSADRIYLRPWEPADIERYQIWLNDRETRTLLRAYRPISIKAEREFVEGLDGKEDLIHFAIVLKEGDRHIGGIGLMEFRWKDRTAALGLFIGPPECRGEGYGTEAIRLVLEYAFRTLNLNRVELCVYASNTAAIRTYEKLGFVREGVRREHVFIDGRYVDEVIYGMLAREFKLG